MSRFNLTRNEMIFMIIALIYVVSPVDFIPELVTGPIGLTDDLAASTLIAATLWRAFQRRKDVDTDSVDLGGADAGSVNTGDVDSRDSGTGRVD